MSNKNKNKLVDLAKIRELAEQKYKNLETFGRTVLGINERQMVHERLINKTKISADEIYLIADDFGLKADDLRLEN